MSLTSNVDVVICFLRCFLSADYTKQKQTLMGKVSPSLCTSQSSFTCSAPPIYSKSQTQTLAAFQDGCLFFNCWGQQSTTPWQVHYQNNKNKTSGQRTTSKQYRLFQTNKVIQLVWATRCVSLRAPPHYLWPHPGCTTFKSRGKYQLLTEIKTKHFYWLLLWMQYSRCSFVKIKRGII